MTAAEFAAEHPDTKTWTAAECETAQNLAACDRRPATDLTGEDAER